MVEWPPEQVFAADSGVRALLAVLLSSKAGLNLLFQSMPAALALLESLDPASARDFELDEGQPSR